MASNVESVRMMIALDCVLLDGARTKIWPLASAGNPGAVEIALKISERREVLQSLLAFDASETEDLYEVVEMYLATHEEVPDAA